MIQKPAAAHFIERARRIAESLELGIAGANGVRPEASATAFKRCA